MKNVLPDSFSGTVCVLYGMGSSNKAVAPLLCKENAKLYLTDKRISKKELSEWAEGKGLKNCEILKYGEPINADFVFRSPGIRPRDEGILGFLSMGASLTSETELFFERANGRIYGITGSDGKTTTATMAYELLKASGKRAHLAGNIGYPLAELIGKLEKDDITVAELSSFQLMTLRHSPSVAAVTSISENHLDYHADMDEYVSAKRRAFMYDECKKLVVGKKTAERLGIESVSRPERIVYTSLEGECDGAYLKNGIIYLYGKELLKADDVRVKGLHNVEDLMTAIGTTCDDITEEAVKRVACEFNGVSHRMELVCVRDGKSFYESSIDSTPSRTLVTVSCFKRPLTVICGGYDKNLDYGELAERLPKYADRVVLTGAAREKIKKALDAFKSDMEIYTEADFDKAVRLASRVTPAGGSVLLSPACASFDAFTDYKQRGERFKYLVKNNDV